ncbi:NucA/NucB deoxyribonuclease domain-containing protein [Lentzea sp. NPDC051838]|uniref:NucA/NucB deoxyribonuclease domain-containing protein n=1 Tax=Lentzea sp. NPDC051838 TaxID=3154849 RepID=UPI00343354D5
MKSHRRRRAAVLTMALAASLFTPVGAHSAESGIDPRGGITSPTLNQDGSVTALVAEPRDGTVEESRRIAMKRGAVADVSAADLAKADETKKQLAVAAEEPPKELLDACLNSPDAKKVGGRVLFRHFWCQENVVHGEYINTTTGKVEGEFTVKYRAAAIGHPFEREMRYYFHGDDYETDGSFSGWDKLSLKVHCTKLTAGCNNDREWVSKDIGDWDDGEWERWVIGSDERVATQQPEKVLRNIFTVSGYAVDSFGRSVELTSLTEPGFRCDSATYFNQEPRACVFTDVLPRLNYTYGNNHDEVVTHIKTAYEHPELTDPRKEGKSVPGRFLLGSVDPRALHRVAYGGTTWAKNSAVKDKECAKLPKKDGQDCDEFPFATTREGAAFGDDNYSVKYVNESHNRSAGSALNTYYRWDRILYEEDPADGVLDEFWVSVP